MRATSADWESTSPGVSCLAPAEPSADRASADLAGASRSWSDSGLGFEVLPGLAARLGDWRSRAQRSPLGMPGRGRRTPAPHRRPPALPSLRLQVQSVNAGCSAVQQPPYAPGNSGHGRQRGVAALPGIQQGTDRRWRPSRRALPGAAACRADAAGSG